MGGASASTSLMPQLVQAVKLFNMVRLWTQKVRGTFWGLSAFYQQAYTLDM